MTPEECTNRNSSPSTGTGRVRNRLLALIVSLAVLCVASIGLAGAASAKPRTADPTTVDVTGTLADGTGAVAGTFDVTRFAVQNGTLQAVGTFTGTVTDAAGTATSGSQQISLPVDLQQSTGSCEILDLVLGPLDLNLLGLEVHLDTVHLNITAQQGPGNLLGNLLCGIANALNDSAPGNVLANLLNQVLAILGP
jgi:hypothetical protein